MEDKRFQAAYEMIEEAAHRLYNIFDHDETSCIFCVMCGAEAKPRKGVYDSRDVKHEEDCIVKKMDAWLVENTPENL